MSVSDPIADFLTRIRNAASAGHKRVTVPATRMRREIARILHESNYVKGYAEIPGVPQGQLVVRLKFTPQHESVISGLERVSRPGLRRFGNAQDLARISRQLGVTIVSTSRGVMTDREAGEQGIGGELICRVW
ncbi:MAG: 30S ribosomal protein S8 [Candidatus Zixiibacteriota bacterium]